MFNTLSYARKLEATGVTREQAEAHVQIIAEIVEGDLATKQDIKELRNDMEKLEYRLFLKLGALVAAVGATTATVVITVLKLILTK